MIGGIEVAPPANGVVGTRGRGRGRARFKEMRLVGRFETHILPRRPGAGSGNANKP